MEENQFAQSAEKQFIPNWMIDANPWQTSQIDLVHAEELAHDIKEHGMMQAPTARQVDGRYQLAFGHHRLAAYRLLSSLGNEYYDNFPLFIHDLNDEQMAIAAFSENEKRRTFNPVDRAKAVQKMLESFPWTQEQVAEKLHIVRSGVSNMLRLLRLPQDVLETVAAGTLPVRSAMALIPLFEITTSEQVRLEDRFGESYFDFLIGAKKGEVNSDVIRARVEFYMNFLRPQPEQLQLADGPVVIENDTITADEGPAEDSISQQYTPPPPSIPTATQTHIDDWLNHSGGEENEPVPTLQPAAEFFAEEAHEGSEHAASVDAQQEIQATQSVPAADHSVEKPVPAELKKDPEDLNAIYLSVAWKTNGVTVSLLKPGWPAPKFRFRNMLKVEMLPDVIREMEHS
jgi:ParB/RepB/Spo0J family partition protein